MKLVLRWYLSGFYKKPKVRGACRKGRVPAKGFVTHPEWDQLFHGMEESQLFPSWPQIQRGGEQPNAGPSERDPCSVFEETALGWVTSTTTHNRVRKGAFDPKLQRTYGICRGTPLENSKSRTQLVTEPPWLWSGPQGQLELGFRSP